MKINDILVEDTESGNQLNGLKRYVHENGYVESIKKLLSTDRVLRHHSEETDLFVVLSNKVDRKPTDTPMYFHKIVDNLMEELTGIRFRSNSLFTYVYELDETMEFEPYNDYHLIPKSGDKAAMIKDINDMYGTLGDRLDTASFKISDDIDTLYKKEYGEKLMPDITNGIYYNFKSTFQQRLSSLDNYMTKEFIRKLLLPEVLAPKNLRDKYEERYKKLEKIVDDNLEKITNNFYKYLIGYIKNKIKNDIIFGSVFDVMKEPHTGMYGEEVMVHSDEYFLINIKHIEKFIKSEEFPEITSHGTFYKYLIG